MWGHKVLLRLNDNFIIQSIPVGVDSLNRAWWFIMGVITQSFSPKSTTWLPTQRTKTHVHGQIHRDKGRMIETERYCHSEENALRRWRHNIHTQRHNTTTQRLSYSQGDGETDTHNHVTTNVQNNNYRCKGGGEWGSDWGMRHSFLMPANSRNNFLVLISEGDSEMRSWLWELISIKIENEIKGD